MSSGAGPLLAWGTTLVAIAALGRLGFGLADEPTALLGVAGLACVAAGAAAGVAEYRRPRAALAGRSELDPRPSLPTMTATIGVVVLLVGIGAIGQAITWLGVVLILVGGYGIGRERWDSRRRLREHERTHRGRRR